MRDKKNEQKMFDNARTFSKTAYFLNQVALGPSRRTQDKDLCLPGSVCAALALELYYKTLHLLEKGVDFKVNGRHSHDFLLLYGLLNMETRQTIESTFFRLIEHRDMSDVQNFEKRTHISIPRDLAGNLSAWKDVFVKMRYTHEPPGRNIPMFFFPEMEDSVLAPILSMRPAWRDSTSYTWTKVT